MGREQGDEMVKGVTYTRKNPVTGEQESRVAGSPTDEVNLMARGWVKQENAPSAPAPAASSNSGVAKSSSPPPTGGQTNASTSETH